MTSKLHRNRTLVITSASNKSEINTSNTDLKQSPTATALANAAGVNN
jgi:hypothetical protein